MPARFPGFDPRGVIPAVLLPFHDDLSVDEAAYRAHLRDVAGVRGVTAITTNAHASEVASCDPEEQDRVLDLTLAEIGDRLPVVNGVYADGTLQAARIARRAAAAGASALLVFPPQVLARGNAARPECLADHVRHIAAATDLPLIAFQYPAVTGLTYPLDTLVRLAEEVPAFRAIKDWCNDAALAERHIQVLQGLARPVNVLSTHSAWLFPSLVTGAAGLLSGSGSVIADLQARLFDAVQAGDLAAAQAINARIRPTAQAFYADPFFDMHNRMKEALVLLGKLPRAVVRPPLKKIEAWEIARIRAALTEAGLLARPALAAE
ncbi:dihydrodipicolinate synthase family protein [Paracraurococcus ruber]|uniref:Dihydrodipicolinate synthase family protein n=1 Tax=Paracraurococcus ruber TaxID=77675 RepID=A0ABS1CYN5_9PROT|nr:dihydrodipicolinate synthase family protein [Paracraurococcus ruber]MBK1658819.1 dihydrodipicolinate synthase family protein [Paracraurococcus ruber]TDG29769.1 dihydrodipicolinate synthase family protein [Paracraurococcus ruber]